MHYAARTYVHTNILEQQGRVIAFEDVCLCVYFSMLSLRATRTRWGGTTLAELSGHLWTPSFRRRTIGRIPYICLVLRWGGSKLQKILPSKCYVTLQIRN